MTASSIRPSVDGFRQFSRDGWTVVEISGEIDIARTPAIHRVLADHPSPGRLVIDLTRVVFMDVSGLTLLVAAWNRAQACEGEFRIVFTKGPVQRLLEITGYDTVLPLVGSLNDVGR
ncbi:MAG: STAS domain-containing protein [Actinomycetota bacterium]|nr:STAS domain-containing protein [Actinomycetota bacterium]